jgi:hypothetical protein
MHPYAAGLRQARRYRLGDLPEEQLLFGLQESLRQGSSAHRLMTRVWRDAGTLRIRREVPYASPRRKILPLRLATSMPLRRAD